MGAIVAALAILSAGLLVSYITNRQAGWGLLAVAYTNQDASKHTQWTFVSARMGNGSTVVPYRAALNIGADTLGIYLQSSPCFD